jgi:hypothetical protein
VSTEAARRWCVELAGTLADVERRLGRLADRLPFDWPDERGRSWAERAAQLRRELVQVGQSASELGLQLARGAAEPGSGRAGVRLGGTAGSRPDDERGVRIAELPPAGVSG